MAVSRSRGSLHLQLGQETIYLIMAIAVFAAVYLAVLARRSAEPSRDPPIILMKEADGYSFPTGSAAISPGFTRRLTAEVLPRVLAISRRYDARIVEVIGHTDEVPLRRATRYEANLDTTLMPLLTGTTGAVPVPVAADNVGLGMARAVAVARLLRDQPGMRALQIVPLSAGAFQRLDDTVTDGTNAISEEQRRRIEVRVRRRADR